MDPLNHLMLYAGTGDTDIIDGYAGQGVMITDDGGTTWRTVTSLAGRRGLRFYKLAINPTDTRIVFGATMDGLFRSMDGGFNWTSYQKVIPVGTNWTDDHTSWQLIDGPSYATVKLGQNKITGKYSCFPNTDTNNTQVNYTLLIFHILIHNVNISHSNNASMSQSGENRAFLISN